MHGPMHGPACSSSQTPKFPTMTGTQLNYMILLLCLSWFFQVILQRSKNGLVPVSQIILNGKTIRSNKNINVMGVIFDSRLCGDDYIASSILKVGRAIRLIKRFFSRKELLQLVASNYFSILYYNISSPFISSSNQTE